MNRRAHLLVVVALAVGGLSSTAHAENMHVVENGQTLYEIAKRSGCSVKELQDANDLRGSMIFAGQTLVVPDCTSGKAGKSKSKRKAKEITERAVNPRDYDLVPAGKVSSKKGQSIGQPWNGSLENAVKLPPGKGYFIRHPSRVWGTSHAVAQIQRAIKAVRKRFPRVHQLAIGDISAKDGGQISDHHSHQTGRDVDIGFYFKKRPEGYPEEFVSFDDADLDLAATWALVYAFARTADQDNGVQVIFLGYRVQKKLYTWAKDHGVPESLLDKVFQYPEEGGTGIVRHEPNHENHIHVRFKCPTRDPHCE